MRRPEIRKKEDGFKDKMLDLRRVTRVVAGGKRFRFRAVVILGDEKGKIGVGVAKGLDVAQAIGKARAAAKKNIIKILLKDNTLVHDVGAKYSAARVIIKPAVKGYGLRAGGAIRTVLTLAGVKDATAKALGATSNKLSSAMATVEALKKITGKKHAISSNTISSEK